MKVTGGSIEKLEKDKANGRCRKWRLAVYADGKLRRRRFAGSYREAQAALKQFREDVEGELPDPGTFGSYARAWVDYRRASGNYAPGTVSNDAVLVGALCRQFGDMALDEITPDACRAGLVEMRANGRGGRELSGTYMNKIYVAFHAIMSQAYHEGRIARDPLARIPAPKVDTKERDWLSPAELSAFVDALGALPLDGRTVCCYLMAYLGLRRGEACGLFVADVDLVSRIVHVRHAVKERDGSIGPTKSNAGTRDLPMPRELASVLSAWMAERTRLGYSSATLACSSADTVLRPQNLQKWWDANRAALGADGMTLHQIRHSNLSMMARHMNVFDLQRWAGWSSIDPAKVYVHADAESLKTSSEDAFYTHFIPTQANRPGA